MVKFGIQLAIGPHGQYLSAHSSSKDDGPFTCVVCSKELSVRKGSKTVHHFIHKKKSDCIGNNDEHREQAQAIGSIDENQDQISEVEPEQVSSNGSIDENQDQISEVEPMDVSDESIDQVLSELIPVESLVEPSIEEDEIEDPDVPSIDEKRGEEEEEPPNITEDVSSEVSNHIIEEALSFVENEILKQAKCTDCKVNGDDFHRMFTQEAIERFGLNDLYVCDSCVVRCPSCDGPNSTKRAKRAPLCFTCDFEENQWREEATEAVKRMEPIPPSPEKLRGRRAIMVLKMLSRKRKARIVYNFMFEHKDRTPEFKNKVGEVLRAKKIAKALMKIRKQTEKNRKRNQQRRESAMGADGSDRLAHMYANRRETCFCGKFNKRRHMVRYSSTMGSVKFSCRSCSKTCTGCGNPCTKNDMDQFGEQCFDCLSWSSTRSEEWKKGRDSVLQACTQGSKWAWAVLYLNAPGVTKGKFSGDSIAHLNNIDIDSVVRRDHPEFKDIGEVIKACRKM